MNHQGNDKVDDQVDQDEVLKIFQDDPEHGLICLVCGSLVPQVGDFPRVHWDWHEASNGA